MGIEWNDQRTAVKKCKTFSKFGNGEGVLWPSGFMVGYVLLEPCYGVDVRKNT